MDIIKEDKNEQNSDSTKTKKIIYKQKEKIIRRIIVYRLQETQSIFLWVLLTGKKMRPPATGKPLKYSIIRI